MTAGPPQRMQAPWSIQFVRHTRFVGFTLLLAASSLQAQSSQPLPRSQAIPQNNTAETPPVKRDAQPTPRGQRAASMSAAVPREALAQALEQRLRITLSGLSLRDSIAQLSATTRVAIVVDRRIDLHQPITLEPNELTLDEVLQAMVKQLNPTQLPPIEHVAFATAAAVAEPRSANPSPTTQPGTGQGESPPTSSSDPSAIEVRVVGGVVYLGPRATAERLVTYAAQLDQQADETLSPSAKRDWLAPRLLAWPAPSTPSDIATQLLAGQPKLAEQVRAATLPHDVWPPATWPELTTGEALTLLLGQFDLQAELKGTSREPVMQISEFGPSLPALQRMYTVQRGQVAQLRQLVSRFPTAQVTPRGNQWEVQGSGELHAAIRAALEKRERPSGGSGNPTRPPARSNQRNNNTRLQLRVADQTLEGVITYLREHLELTITVAPELQADLARRVSFEARDATVDEVLEQLAQTAGWQVRRNGQQVEFTPRQ